MLRGALALLVALSAMAFAAGAAQAETGYTPASSFGATQGPNDGETSNPQDAAVQTSTGNVFVADRDNNRVQVFEPHGADAATYLVQFSSFDLFAPSGIAIDQSTGDVYVSDADNVIKFTSDNAPTPTFTQDVTFATPGVTGPLAFDQSSHQLLVADTTANVVRRYDADGSADATTPSFDGGSSGTAFTQLRDIAVQDDGDVVVVDANRVVQASADGTGGQVLPNLPGYPTVVTAIPGGSDLIVGQSGGYSPDFIETPPSARLYHYSAGLFQRTTVLPEAFQGLFGLVVSAAADGNLYAVTGAALFGAGDVAVRVLRPFTIQAATISDLTAVPGEIAARLRAKIDTKLTDTSWTFEYGTTTSYGKTYPATPTSLAGGPDPVVVTRTIGGLERGTTYHYRVTATNAGGESHSADQTFTTKVPATPGDGARDDGRTYEQVSPVDKGGVDVSSILAARSSTAGGAVLYGTDGAFPDAAASRLSMKYVSRRGSDGWETVSIDPPLQNRHNLEGGGTVAVSGDLSRAIGVSTRALLPGAIEGGSNFYTFDTQTKERKLTYATSSPAAYDDLTPYASVYYAGDVTPDLSRFAFNTSGALTDDAPAGQRNAFELAGGSVHLVGAPVPGTLGAWAPNGRVMSDDGRRIFFSSTANLGPGGDGYGGALYMTQDGGPPTLVAHSRRAGDDPAVPVGARMNTATADGRYAYFQTTEPLTDGAVLSGGLQGGGNLYRYDVASGELVNIAGSDPQVEEVLGVSDDGERVYFTASGALAAGAVPGVRNVYTWHDGAIDFVGVLSAIEFTMPLTYASSPDGSFFVYSTLEAPAGYDNHDPSCRGTLDPQQTISSGVCAVTYAYDAATRHTTCISCDADMRPASTGLGAGRVFPVPGGAYGRAVLNDGRVFFDSDQQLLSQDTNGRKDVYEWQNGQLSLISPGTGPNDAVFADASSDGKDVFFITDQRLVGQDNDANFDMYDAREGGGLAAQDAKADSVTACEGDGCQGNPGPPAPAPLVGSLTFSGAGDVAPSVTPAVSTGKVAVSRLKSVTGALATLKVRVPAAGVISVSGSGLHTVKRSAAKAATYSVKVKLTAKATAALKKKTLRVKARVGFKSAAGATSAATLVMTFKQPKARASKRRHVTLAQPTGAR